MIIAALAAMLLAIPAMVQSKKGEAAKKAVPQGSYKVVVEATLFFDSDIIYSGTFSTKDKAGDIKLTSTLTKEDEQHKNMVTNVKAVLKWGLRHSWASYGLYRQRNAVLHGGNDGDWVQDYVCCTFWPTEVLAARDKKRDKMKR